MDRQQTKLIVLARIPDLSVSEHKASPGNRLASRGRVISQALSFKLLAVLALLLVAMAIVPLTVNKTGSPTDSPPAIDPVAARQPNSPAVLTNAGTGPIAPVAQTAVSTPTLVRPSPVPSVPPQPVIATTPPAPAPTPAAAAPLMSAWPNPGHPTSTPEAGSNQPQASLNQAMAIRPSENRNKL
jgi:hypothetical protein